MKASDALALLDQIYAKLKRMKGDDLAGFYVVCPPDGDPLWNIFEGTLPTSRAFYQYLAERAAEQQKSTNEQSGYGGAFITARR